MYRYLFILFLLTTSLLVNAHPGRTNSEGCHTNRKTGEYHCHGTSKKNQNSALQKQEPVTQSQNTVVQAQSGNIRRLDYEGFTIWIDCARRGAVKFQYNAQRDSGNFERSDKFFLDPNVPAECQQYSGKA